MTKKIISGKNIMVIEFPWHSDKRCAYKRVLKQIQSAKSGQRRKKKNG